MSKSKKSSPASTSSSTAAPPPALSKDQLKGFLIDFLDQLAAAKPPVEAQQPIFDGQIETTMETSPSENTTSKSPHSKEETPNGVRFVDVSNPSPSMELLPNWSSRPKQK
jgi:hypothetical protein